MTSLQSIASLLETPPYSLRQPQKVQILLPRLNELTRHHYTSSDLYRNVIDRVFGGLPPDGYERIEDIPFLPVSLFKTRELRSISEEQVFKVLTSSGTTGQAVSKVYLDGETASIQAKVLVKIMQHFVGKQRVPMVILDHKGVTRNRQSFSARGAGILGMLQFGRNPFYALNEEMELDAEGLMSYLANAQGTVLFFGFTFMVWQYFILALEQQDIKLDLPEAILIHSGGWKKLQDMAVSAEEFRQRVQATTGIQHNRNFYGMVEQVGSVYVENALHYLHAPLYSDVIIRDPLTLAPLPPGKSGLVQVVSMLPTSYPGHSILTEDLGMVYGVDHPELEMGGRYFQIMGRVPAVEMRGCSDTFHSA